MARPVLLWGHGAWRSTDGYTNVPLSCKLYFFARHGEVISTDRMDHIFWTVLQSVESSAVWPVETLGREGHLRRICNAGRRVKNYRLYPPSEGVVYHDVEEKLLSTCDVVMTERDDGETLAELFARYPNGNTDFLWVPCRAVESEDPGRKLFQDIWPYGEGIQVQAPLYKRENDYVKG